jgi:glycosyltransferase involved in cell wall biosynthesis
MIKDRKLKIAYLVYRGNPRCGGQGVYTRHLTKELSDMGHYVEVFSGPPYPELDDRVKLNKVESLDLYREPDPFRRPKLNEFKSSTDLLEYLMMLTGVFPEPKTFSIRVRKVLKERINDFDLVHDNQCLGSGLFGIIKDGWPLLGTIHHPITVDRELDLSHATTFRKRLSVKRWYGFLKMQKKVGPMLPRVVTVSESSKKDISSQLNVPLEKMHVVPVGVDYKLFRPKEDIQKIKGRIMTTASADVPMKGLIPLLEAIAKVRTEAEVSLVVIGKLKIESEIPKVLDRLNIKDIVNFVHGISDEQIVDYYGESEIAAVPSLYEGFSLPAIEAMACGVPLVTTSGGALPEVVGSNYETAVIVPPNDPSALAIAILELLNDKELRIKLGNAGRNRVMTKYTWRNTAEGTLEQYYELLKQYDRL